jgi:anti-sigma regulatory factor (Ser/Thr protein kinase)
MANTFTSYKMEERSYVSYIKREIHNRVARARFAAHQGAQIDIIVSELASNIIKHAERGELLVRVEDHGALSSTFEIISIDNGPGMADTTSMLKDGTSTTRTLGQGLGAVSRLSNVWQLYSIPGWGTIHYAMVTTEVSLANKTAIQVRALCVNKPREEVCGDGFNIKRTKSAVSIFFGDGLGHGLHAKAAIDAASEFFAETREDDPVAMIKLMHGEIRRTRGLVGIVVNGDIKSRHWRICGVGNIAARIYSGLGFKNYMSYNGTIGLTIPGSMKASMYPMESNQHLIMCSDGIKTRWDLNRYPSILKFDNIILASAIYKDFARGLDDASVLIAKVA